MAHNPEVAGSNSVSASNKKGLKYYWRNVGWNGVSRMLNRSVT